MSEYKKTDTSLSSKIYLLLLILYITTLFFPIVTDYELTGWDWPLINLTAFIIGGYHGMTLLFISFFYISKFRFIRFLICSIFGSLAIGINYIFLYFNDYMDNAEGINSFAYSLNFFINFGLWISLVIYNLVFISSYYRQKDPLNENRLRKMILDSSTKIEKLTLKEICKESGIYDVNVIKLIKEMLKNNLINGEYFRSTKTLQFDIKENLEDIDKLIALYKEWEDINIKKKG